MKEIAVTLGDPCGIGPEVFMKAFDHVQKEFQEDEYLCLFTSRNLLESFDREKLQNFESSGHLKIKELSSVENEFEPAKPSLKSAQFSLQYLDAAIHYCLDKKLNALVTGPVDKFICSKEIPSFRGQTELLKKKTKSEFVTMLLSGPDLSVALVTTHIPLKEVSAQLSPEKIIKTSIQTYDYMKEFSPKPSLAVCGLNPHASDRGLMGEEEREVITPAVQYLQSKGVNVEGPLPSDTLFYFSDRYQAIICMYHDQGLIPLKMKNFEEAVNITLGLPFLRVSVDHGTAFDIAGQNKASSKSFQSAIRKALQWNRKK